MHAPVVGEHESQVAEHAPHTAVTPTEKVSGPQALHVPVALSKPRPGGQVRQAPVMGLHVAHVEEQGVQVAVPPAENLPTVHAVHTPRTSPAPVLHWVHVPTPLVHATQVAPPGPAEHSAQAVESEVLPVAMP